MNNIHLKNKPKCDRQLGSDVNAYLTTLGLGTPVKQELLEYPDQHKIDIIQGHMVHIMEALGLDLTDDSLAETPTRVAKMYVQEIYGGLTNDNFPKCTVIENKFDTSGNEFVLEKNITLYSDCEHHLRTIVGKCHIAYIPSKKVLGLSKLNRVAEYFARRPQVQERLTQQIAHAIAYITESDDVIVSIDASHMCVSQRGIKDTSSSTVTAAALGKFGTADSQLRREFMAAIR